MLSMSASCSGLEEQRGEIGGVAWRARRPRVERRGFRVAGPGPSLAWRGLRSAAAGTPAGQDTAAHNSFAAHALHFTCTHTGRGRRSAAEPPHQLLTLRRRQQAAALGLRLPRRALRHRPHKVLVARDVGGEDGADDQLAQPRGRARLRQSLQQAGTFQQLRSAARRLRGLRQGPRSGGRSPETRELKNPPAAQRESGAPPTPARVVGAQGLGLKVWSGRRSARELVSGGRVFRVRTWMSSAWSARSLPDATCGGPGCHTASAAGRS